MLSIIIPTFNEKDNLRPLAQRIDAALHGVTEYEVVFVDDSVDDTPALMEVMSNEDRRIRYRHRSGEKGLASAVVLGMGMAKGEILACMDADLQHPPEMLATMYRAILSGADIVLPSRYIDGGGDEGLNAFRKLASNTAKWIGVALLKPLRHVSDPTSGFFMMRSAVVKDRPLNPLGWKILMEVLVMGDYGKVVEIPYSFVERNAGVSKMSLKVTLQYFVHVFSLMKRGWPYRNKKTQKTVMR